MLNATPDVKTKTGVAIFAALRECVVGLDGPAAGVMEQWEKETAMCVLKRKVNINFNFSLQNTTHGGDWRARLSGAHGYE